MQVLHEIRLFFIGQRSFQHLLHHLGAPGKQNWALGLGSAAQRRQDQEEAAATHCFAFFDLVPVGKPVRIANLSNTIVLFNKNGLTKRHFCGPEQPKGSFKVTRPSPTLAPGRGDPKIVAICRRTPSLMITMTMTLTAISPFQNHLHST